MLYLLAQGFWFILPAMYSNMAPIWAKKMPMLEFLDRPIDSNKKLFGKPIFGRNKTYRGFAAGALFALIVGLAQFLASEHFDALNRLEFFEMGLREYASLSLLLGVGALVGDATESFLKRQVGIKPGEPWFPFDQIDYVLGAFMFSLPIGALNLSEYLAAAVVGFFMHPLATFVGWKLGLKDKPI